MRIPATAGKFEATDAGLQAAGGLVEIIDRPPTVADAVRRESGGLPELGQRLADMLRAEGLGPHALIHALHAGSQGLHTGDHLVELRGDA